MIKSCTQLLSKPKFSLVEKIKTIGSNYMVAAGLMPGVEARQEVHSFPSQMYHETPSVFQISREQHFAVVLIEFALQMMVLLEQINKESFQVIID